MGSTMPSLLSMTRWPSYCYDMLRSESMLTSRSALILSHYVPFLRAQGHNPDVLIVPPVEIQAVWLSHMLNSLSYLLQPRHTSY